MQPITGGERKFETSGDTVRIALENLVCHIPALKQHLFTNGGAVRHNILCIHKGEYIRNTDVHCRAVSAGDTIRIVNSIAGGR